MKIVFLDIDGVVNCAKSNWNWRGFTGIDPTLVLYVNRILEATGAKVVLSSTWRHGKETREEVRRQVVDFIDITPALAGFRGDEIQRWLDGHPEVTKYAILDDDNDMLDSQRHSFFRTSWDEGLTEPISKRVIAHLNA